eukprot:UN33423
MGHLLLFHTSFNLGIYNLAFKQLLRILKLYESGEVYIDESFSFTKVDILTRICYVAVAIGDGKRASRYFVALEKEIEKVAEEGTLESPHLQTIKARAFMLYKRPEQAQKVIDELTESIDDEDINR